MASGGWGPQNGPGWGNNQAGGWVPQNGPGPYGPPQPGAFGPPQPPQPYPYPPQPQPPYGPPTPQPFPYGPFGPQPARRSGCLTALAAPLRSSRRHAAAIFNRPGGGRVDDPLVLRVQLWRTLVGGFASVLLLYVYGTDGGWSGAVDDGISKLIMAPILLIVTGPLVVIAFILYAPAAHRPVLRSRLRTPLKTMGWYFLLIAAGAVVVAGGTQLMSTSKQPWSGLVGLAVLIAMAWLLPFFGFASANAARYAFNTANVHAALPAVLTVVLVWELMLVSMANDGMPNGPLPAQLASVFGGPLSVTVVAMWELRRLRVHHGVRVRP